MDPAHEIQGLDIVKHSEPAYPIDAYIENEKEFEGPMEPPLTKIAPVVGEILNPGWLQKKKADVPPVSQ